MHILEVQLAHVEYDDANPHASTSKPIGETLQIGVVLDPDKLNLKGAFEELQRLLTMYPKYLEQMGLPPA